jgi:peroxiredoxin
MTLRSTELPIGSVRSDPDPRPQPSEQGRLTPGTVVSAPRLTDVRGDTVDVPDADGGRLVHLQFRRFAGCPICNLHLRSVVRRHDELAAAGVREVVVFHSPADDLLVHAGDLPFAVVADPGKQLYVAFGVESGKRALLSPGAWPAIVRGITRDLGDIVRRRRSLPAPRQPGGRLGLPADLLIAPDGRIVACHYGAHADDQWSVDEVLAVAASAATASAPAPG